MNEDQEFKLVPPGSGKTVSLVGDIYTFLMVGEETGGAYAFIEVVIPPQGGPPPHIHRREDEAFYVLEGELEFMVNRRTVKAGPGSFLHLPKNSLHCFKNVSSTTARMLVHVAPAGLEKFFEEVGHPLKDKSAGPAPVTPADIEKLVAVAPKYGIEIKLPPA